MWANNKTPKCPDCGEVQDRATFSPPIGKVVRRCVAGHTWRTQPSTRKPVKGGSRPR